MTPLNFQQGLVQPPVEQKWSKRISVQCRDPISTPNFLGTLHFHKDMAANERRQQNIRQSKGIISSSWGSISIRFFVFFPHLLIYLLGYLLLFLVWVVPKICNLKSETCSSWTTRTHSNREFMGKTFQAAKLTHEGFLTMDHSCKIFFWYLLNWASTDLVCSTICNT